MQFGYITIIVCAHVQSAIVISEKNIQRLGALKACLACFHFFLCNTLISNDSLRNEKYCAIGVSVLSRIGRSELCNFPSLRPKFNLDRILSSCNIFMSITIRQTIMVVICLELTKNNYTICA